MNKQDVLDKCTIQGTVVFLPKEQLDRKLYQEVNKSLQGIGGKWDRKEQGFVFSEDPSGLMGRVQAGEKVNLKKEFQAFFTPDVVAQHVVKKAIEFAHKPILKVLEPSAGDGALVTSILDNCNDDVDVTAVEIQESNCKKLEANFQGRVKVINADFLEFAENCEDRYDLISANPPFSKNQDIKHLLAMLRLLKPGGVVACIMSTGWIRNETKTCQIFRKLIGMEDPNGDSEKYARNLSVNGGGSFESFPMNFISGIGQVKVITLDSGTFKESGTLVATSVVMIKTIG